MSSDFKYKIIGNWCQGCCDCLGPVGESAEDKATREKYEKCCNTSTAECYDSRKCKLCIDVDDIANPGLQKIVDLCNDPNYPTVDNNPNVKQKKTSCCNGECYDERCYYCDNNLTIQPKFDSTSQGCCPGQGIYNKWKCENCTIDSSGIGTIVKNSCLEDNQMTTDKDLVGATTCCEGEKPTEIYLPEEKIYIYAERTGTPGKCYDERCFKCNNQALYKPELEPICPRTLVSPEDDSKTSCCGGECYDPKDTCYECKVVVSSLGGNKTINLLEKICPSGKCCDKECCPNASDLCCDTADGSRCYSPICDVCE